ncbi:MAG TPA: flagellar motor protein [Thermodesulfovibrionales bacterium]|jgi:chemotaxis protein MotA|nr:flagellar motor protein [Thermodesulfovibrionales bacterium]
MDRSSLIGILLGIVAVIGGNLLEGGKITSVLQATAAAIVFGGTFGATMLSFPLQDILKATSSLRDVFFGEKIDSDVFLKDILRYSAIARRNGLIALEPEISKITDTFFQKAMRLAVDGMGPKMLKETMEQENITYEDEKRRIAKVFETAGGFAPTIGIIGAVLGLIHVMENLSDPAKLGSGIAVAFVATIYGVGSANLILLPMSKKLVNRLHCSLLMREMVLEGVVGIQSGMNTHYLEEKLRAFLDEGQRG